MSNISYQIEGGYVLEGEVRLSGAKNAVLPMLVAACLGTEQTVLENVPIGLNDVNVMLELLRTMGASVVVEGNTVSCARGDLNGGEIPAALSSKIRYSLLLLGLCAAMRTEVYLPMPGGCQIGDRKYDLHLMGLRKLGAYVEERPEGIYVQAAHLQGNCIDFYLPTTSGTENIMIAAVLANGETIIRNANTRPEVKQLGELLRQMGARVTVQNRIVQIEGVDQLQGGARMVIMPGWDEAVTYIVAAGVTQGEIALLNFELVHIKEDARYIREAGIELFEWQGNVYVTAKNAQKRPFELFTAPYPGVNSDMQPIFAALALTILGTSVITDLRFTDRFKYVEQLKRFGANIEAFGNTAIIQGGIPLSGTQVVASDLRGGAACVLCGLVADGQTQIQNVYQIERGYENMVEKLSSLGALINKCETKAATPSS